jgi:hypothetical protein
MKKKVYKLTPKAATDLVCTYDPYRYGHPIDDFFYGSFESLERRSTDDELIVTLKSGFKCPVEDWRKGKRMSGEMLRAFAAHFFKMGLVYAHENADSLTFEEEETR